MTADPEKQPGEVQRLYWQAMDLAGQGMDDAALLYFTRAVAIAPCFSHAHYEMGNCHLRLGRLQEAATCYGKALGTITPSRYGDLCKNRNEEGEDLTEGGG